MRIKTVTVLFMSLTLTACAANINLKNDCLSNCEVNKRSCDNFCPPSGIFDDDTRPVCLQKCSKDFITCNTSCPQPESNISPSSSP